MVLGIISLISFIAGLVFYFYGDDDGNLLWLALGIVLLSIGLLGIIGFIGVNLDTIKNWFKI